MSRNTKQLSSRERVTPTRRTERVVNAPVHIEAPRDNEAFQVAEALRFFGEVADVATKKAMEEERRKGLEYALSGVPLEAALEEEGLENSRQFYEGYMEGFGGARGVEFYEKFMADLQNPEEFNPAQEDYSSFAARKTQEFFGGLDDPVAREAAYGMIAKAHADGFGLHQRRNIQDILYRHGSNVFTMVQGYLKQGLLGDAEAKRLLEDKLRNELGYTNEEINKLYLDLLRSEAAVGNVGVFEQFRRQIGNHPPLANGIHKAEFEMLEQQAQARYDQLTASQRAAEGLDLWATIDEQINSGKQLGLNKYIEYVRNEKLTLPKAWEFYQRELRTQQESQHKQIIFDAFLDNSWHLYTGGHGGLSQDEVQKYFDDFVDIVAQANGGDWVASAMRLSQLNGLTSTKLKNLFESANVAMPEQFLETATVFQQMYSLDPRLPRRYVSDRNFALYTAVNDLRTAGVQEAQIVEMLRNSDLEANREKFYGSEMQEAIEDELSRVQFHDGFLWFNLDGDEVTNYPLLKEHVRQVAESLAITGLYSDPTQIVETAVEKVRENSFVLPGGFWMPVNKETPPNIEEAMEWYRETEFPKIAKRYGIDPDDIVVMPDKRTLSDRNSFTVYEKGSYWPLATDYGDKEPIRFTLQEVALAYLQHQNAERVKEGADEAHAEVQKRRERIAAANSLTKLTRADFERMVKAATLVRGTNDQLTHSGPRHQ